MEESPQPPEDEAENYQEQREDRSPVWRRNMEKDQTPGSTTASLYQHMLEADLTDMVAKQDLQPRAMGEDRTKTNHRL